MGASERTTLIYRDVCGRTPLLLAAQKGHEAVVKLLLETSKVNVNSKDDMDGRTPLSWAARNGHEVVVKLLQPFSYRSYLFNLSPCPCP